MRVQIVPCHLHAGAQDLQFRNRGCAMFEFPRLWPSLATVAAWYWATHDPYMWTWFLILLFVTVGFFLWDNRYFFK